jgi:diguanylate cyclase (GGDEF)-like protein
MFKRISFRKQLYGLCAIFFFPIVLLATLLSVQAFSTIDFSKKEREGVDYLKTVVPIVISVAKGDRPNDRGALSAASTAYDNGMKSWEPSTRFRVTQSAGKSVQETTDAGVKLITAIGDGSNLILDPDLDSYYVMNITVARMPTLIQQFSKLHSLLAANPDPNSLALRNDLNLLRGQIVSTRNGLETDMYAAIRNNGDGMVADKVLKNFSNLANSVDNIVLAISNFTSTAPSSAENATALAQLNASYKPMLSKIQISHLQYLDVLDMLLRKRIDNLYFSLALSLIAAIAAVGLALFCALQITNRIASSVSKISNRIHAMVDGDLTSPIPLQSQKDEIGNIARSLTIFRAHASENAQLSATLEAEREQTRVQLERLAYFDDLTDLPNRKFLHDRINKHINLSATHAASALIYLDLDGFKEVNDTMSHLAGDEVLKEVARRLTHLVGANDMVARLGGDEFAIFLENAGDRIALEKYSVSVIEALAQPYRVFNGEQFLSASAGVAVTILSRGQDTVELIRRADVSMYRAKAMGKNRVIFFDPSFDDESLYKKAIESALRDALTRGEVQLHFQPQFDVKTSKLVGVEGLARWTSQRHGEISPTVFIPIAESSGLIYELGMQILRKAIEAALGWPQLRVSINLSVAQLRHASFLDDINAIIKETNAPCERIELELTESMVMDDDPVLASKLNALHDLGFELALDDFGTGFSSLGYLSHYHFDRLKIDRGFIRGASESARGAALLEAIAKMGRALGMDVCAEGVETYEDVRSTTEAGCTMLQGFYFSPAVPRYDIDHMIAGGLAKQSEARVETIESSRLDQLEQASVKVA